MGVSKNSGIPKSSILIGFSIINRPFWGIPIFGNTRMESNLFFPSGEPDVADEAVATAGTQGASVDSGHAVEFFVKKKNTMKTSTLYFFWKMVIGEGKGFKLHLVFFFNIR